MRSFSLLIILGTLLVSLSSAKVHLPDYNLTYASTPALFGGSFETNETYSALITYFAEEPLLCQDPSAESVQSTLLDYYPAPSANGAGDEELELPIAILVQRGECTFYEKARIASQYPGVEYVIVYNSEKDQPLVPMASDYDTDMRLLFVSYETGSEIRQFILEHRSQKDDKLNDFLLNNNSTSSYDIGIRIDMDSISPPLAYQENLKLNVTGYLLAALTGFFAFLIFFGCVLLAAQAGIIRAHPDGRGRLVLFPGRRSAAGSNSGALAANSGLLTQDQVAAIAEEKFDAKKENEETDATTNIDEEQSSSGCCCSICLEEFEDQELIRTLPCQHKYHGECVVPWLTERSGTCPLCKFDVLEHLEHNAESESGTKGQSQSSSTAPRRSLWSRIVGGYSNVRRTSSSDDEEEEGARSNNNNSSATTQESTSIDTTSTIAVEMSSSLSPTVSGALNHSTTNDRSVDTTVDYDLELAEESLDDIELSEHLSSSDIVRNQNEVYEEEQPSIAV